MIATMQHNPADVALDLIGRDYISWSAISTFQQCPLRFFYRYVERLPKPTVAASLVFGGATGAKLVITDFKTSRSRWNQEHVEDAAEQLILYASLVQDLSPGKDIGLRFIVVTKTKEPVVEQHSLDLDPQRAERTKHVAERVWSAIETGNYYPAPSPMSCGGCPFREPCRQWSG